MVEGRGTGSGGMAGGGGITGRVEIGAAPGGALGVAFGAVTGELAGALTGRATIGVGRPIGAMGAAPGRAANGGRWTGADDGLPGVADRGPNIIGRADAPGVAPVAEGRESPSPGASTSGVGCGG